MRYLKKFESITRDENLYYEIDGLGIDKTPVDLEERVINMIKSRLIKNFSIKDMDGIYVEERWCRIDYLTCEPNCKACKGLGGKHSKITDFYFDIFQLDDEWFDVEYLDARHKGYGKYFYNSHYFRCDGIDGLLKFLEDERIIL